ncbi:MAG: HlyD family efflux transporter periplasmic adaptor subunit [Chloroflexi bacterium]|nr:HlyD family efflux transporter periplasmic adaptor subunit [Chloroflexota bacterium]
MSSQRLLTAVSLTLREFLRRRGMLAFVIGVPVLGFLAIYGALPDTPASLDAVDNGVTIQVPLTQLELFGGVSALIYVALMAGIVGLYLMQSALKADRRLIVAGFSATELLTARLGVLLLLDVALTAFMVSLALFFAVPRQFLPYVLAVFWAAAIYSFYGALTGVVVRGELGGIIAVMFLANIDIGYLQLPGFSTVLEEWWIVLLPGYFPVQLAIDAAFTARAELFWPSFWSIPHGMVVAGAMLAAYQRATTIHPFLPERQGRRALRWLLVGVAVLIVGAGAGLTYRYYQDQPATVEADGRVRAPEGRVISPVSGRVQRLLVSEGQEVAREEIIAWIEEWASARTLPLRAPVVGRVTGLPVRQGENVVPGSAIATVHELHRMEVTLEVEETAIARVAVGQRVELTFASLGATQVGTVRDIAQEPLPPEAGVAERTRRVRKYAVKVTLPQPDDRLRLGMAVRGRIFP